MQNRWTKIFRIYAIILVFLLITMTYLTKAFYLAFEGKEISWPLALMFVLETLTTTGYGELLPFYSWQMTLWAALVMVVGLALIFIFLATAAAEWLKHRFQELPPEQAPKGIRDHIVICYYNPLVEFLIRELLNRSQPMVVVEPDRETAAELMRKGVQTVWGDPSEGQVLKAARIETAAAVITAASDQENANVVLQARILSKCPIITTVENEAHRKNLEYAGASTIVNPKAVLGEALSRWALSNLPRTLIAAAASVSGLQLMEIPVYPHSEFAGKTISEVQLREKTGATILGLWHNGVFHMADSPETRIRENSVVIVVGTPRQLARFRDHQYTTHQTTNIARLAPTINSLMEYSGRQEAIPEHHIVAGYGDVGRKVVEILRSHNIRYTIIADAPIHEEKAVIGDPTIEDTLKRAGIIDARVLIVTLDSDSQAVFTTLLARRLNPSIRILVRVSDVRAIEKLYQAGADTVLSLSEFGGQMLARALYRKDWRELPDQDIEFMECEVGDQLSGRTIAEANIFRETGCLVIGVSKGGVFQPNPSAHTRLESGSTIILLGRKENLSNFIRRYGAKAVAKSE